MAAAASEAAQQHAAAAEQAEKHEMHVFSKYSMASHVALAAVSAREELSDQHDTTALENLNWRARSREAAFMDCVGGECVWSACGGRDDGGDYLAQANCAVWGSQPRQPICPGSDRIPYDRSGPEPDPKWTR